MADRLEARVARLRAACPRAFLGIDTNGDLLTPTRLRALEGAGPDAILINAYDRPSGAPGASRTSGSLPSSTARGPEGRVENRGGSIRRKLHLFDPARVADRGCDRPSRSLQIRANGDLVPCCADLYGDVVIGNVTEAGLVELWRAPTLEALHHRLATRGRHGRPLCGACSHDGSGSFRVPRRPSLRRGRATGPKSSPRRPCRAGDAPGGSGPEWFRAGSSRSSSRQEAMAGRRCSPSPNLS